MPEAAPLANHAPDHLTLGAQLRHATAELGRSGIEDAGNDARRLLAAVLGLSAAQMLSRPEQLLSPQQAERFGRAIARRRGHEPVARIIGARDFYGRSFTISPATLDPRPDSETLIEAALEFAAREGWLEQPIRLLDVGTGSGCLLLTLLSELPNAVGVGTDISAAALDVARHNAHRLGLADRAEWRVADALEGIDGPFDILVCNPPYVRSGDIARLAPEVKGFDPLSALDGGDDGLRFFRNVSASIRSVIPEGWAVLEVGYDQADAVAGLLMSDVPQPSRGPIEFRRDVTGRRRCVAVRTRN
jgi:release factor glutamine methyltransferase